MTKRLRDMHELSSPDEAEAARLLRVLGPATLSPAAERRVYASLGVKRRMGPRVMRIVAVSAGTVVVTTVLGTALAMSLHYIVEARQPALPAPPARPVAQARAKRSVRLPPSQIWEQPAPEPTSTPAAAAPASSREQAVPRPEPLPAPVAFPPRNRAPSPRPAAETPSPAVDITAARVAVAPPEEAALVLDGLRALRREHDATRAGVPLARYLTRFPEGALVQEALAISIEAALVRGDHRAAAGLAEQYLKRFPAGRFVGFARKATDRPSP
jgi:hypothetical protein